MLIFILNKSLLLCPEFVVPVGMSKPPGTTIQHASLVPVVVLRPSAQLAGSGLVRSGLKLTNAVPPWGGRSPLMTR